MYSLKESSNPEVLRIPQKVAEKGASGFHCHPTCLAPPPKKTLSYNEPIWFLLSGYLNHKG